MDITLIRLGTILTLAIGLGAYTGCASEVSPGDSDTEDDGSSASNESSGSGQSSNDGSSTSGGSTGSGTQECGASNIDPDDPCEVCVATSCTTEALNCCNQEGCLDIISCAQETGCDGIDCYSPDTCQAVIDAAGGPSIAVEYAQPLGDCALSKCEAECGDTPS